MKLLVATLAITVGLAAAPAAAQDREPASRQILLELANTLGESHYLRQLCRGEDDQFWRERMRGLIAAERADPAFEQRLKTNFNTGYRAGEARHSRCSTESKAAESRAADRGAQLARRLAQTQNQ